MANYLTTDSELTSVANAIRTKGGTSAQLTYPNGFIQAINDISGGGGLDYNVTLNVDGDDWQILSVKSGNSISQPTNPVKSGYVFSGWSTTQGGSVNVTFPYTPTGDVTWYAVFNTVLQYKASPVGYGNSSPSSVTFSSNSNLVNWTPEEVTKDGNIFIKFPTFYRKVVATSNGQITSFIISSWKEDNNFEPYPCFVDENGNVLPYILIGKYMISSSIVANSVNATKVSLTMSAGRTLCRAKGTGYQAYDWQMHKLFQDLVCCKLQKINTNDGTGFTEILGIAHQDQSFGIDGVARDNTSWVFSYKPSAYVDSPTSSTTDYNVASYSTPSFSSSTTSGEVSKLGYDTSNPFFNYPNAMVTNSNYDTYYCDATYYSTSNTNTPVVCSVGYAHAYYGAFSCSAFNSWSYSHGVRLCYRPL